MGRAAVAIVESTPMTPCFFYGALCHAPLRKVVLGRDLAAQKATLAGYNRFWANAAAFPTLVAGGEGIDGCLVQDLSTEEIARLTYYAKTQGYHMLAAPVTATNGDSLLARVCFADEGGDKPGEAWDIALWADLWAETMIEAARDVMAQYGHTPAERLRRRCAQMLVRSGARVRARQLRADTETLRRKVDTADVVCRQVRWPYGAYFAVEEYQLAHRRHDGAMSGFLDRAVFISGDAAIVLPYDPVRDRVMLIEQFRPGPFARGDANPWLIETVAGRIDGGETPEQAARREAMEEVGLELRALHAGPNYYPSPAAKAEYLYSFVGIADLPDQSAGLGGLEVEAEDIRSHVISFDRLMELVASGEVDNAPLLILAYWLSGKRAAFRAAI
jgi:ADP-ribose pyrophosphatase